jgi:hypothetical protein
MHAEMIVMGVTGRALYKYSSPPAAPDSTVQIGGKSTTVDAKDTVKKYLGV